MEVHKTRPQSYALTSHTLYSGSDPLHFIQNVCLPRDKIPDTTDPRKRKNFGKHGPQRCLTPDENRTSQMPHDRTRGGADEDSESSTSSSKSS